MTEKTTMAHDEIDQFVAINWADNTKHCERWRQCSRKCVVCFSNLLTWSVAEIVYPQSILKSRLSQFRLFYKLEYLVNFLVNLNGLYTNESDFREILVVFFSIKRGFSIDIREFSLEIREISRNHAI